MDMETVNVRLTKRLITLMDRAVKKGMYPNRSEFIRDAVRRMFEERVSPEILEDIRTSSKEMDAGKYIPHNAVKKSLGIK
jgi:Arc/MetJ-type ribon-helix-helix transcriptional regulator